MAAVSTVSLEIPVSFPLDLAMLSEFEEVLAQGPPVPTSIDFSNFQSAISDYVAGPSQQPATQMPVSTTKPAVRRSALNASDDIEVLKYQLDRYCRREDKLLMHNRFTDAKQARRMRRKLCNLLPGAGVVKKSKGSRQMMGSSASAPTTAPSFECTMGDLFDESMYAWQEE